MKPTRVQYFFASRWPLRLWVLVVPLLCVGAVGYVLRGCLGPYGSGWEVVCFWFYLAVAGLLGWCLALFPGWLFIGPLFYYREMKNGGPFKAGDMVQVLTGPHKGRVSRVYSAWQGDTVRVELGEVEKIAFRDVFSPVQLVRVETLNG